MNDREAAYDQVLAVVREYRAEAFVDSDRARYDLWDDVAIHLLTRREQDESKRTS